MKYIIILLILLFCQVSEGEEIYHIKEKDYYLHDSCDGCMKRFEAYHLGKYEVCEECFDKFREKSELHLHPSRYCGPWCAHGATQWELDGCSYENAPKIIKLEETDEKYYPDVIDYDSGELKRRLK